MTRRHAIRAFAALFVLVAIGACTAPPGASGPPVGTAPGTTSVSGTVHAGPTCPVSRPGDSACADRPVPGAVLVVTTPAGAEVARTTSAADGTFGVALGPGDYILVPQPVGGLMGTAEPIPFHVAAGATPAPLDISYDTGIR